MQSRFVLALLFMSLAPAVAAQDDPRPGEKALMTSYGYLAAHPDQRWRRRGLAALKREEPEEAFDFFRRAARYADKPSQAMIAEMLWTGWGVPVDRPLAYAWMDLAAERAYLPFLAKREEYWEALAPAERAAALAAGPGIYLEYGDEVAKRRLEFKLRLGKPRRGGLRSAWDVFVPGVAGLPKRIPGATYYDDRYWEPDEYWAWQDSIWRAPNKGVVEVQPLEVVDDEAPGRDAADD